MLKRLNCNVFREKSISFTDGLNVVLGDELGSNSIGKSSMLMIIDFAYGGTSYLVKNSDTVKYLGHHHFDFEMNFGKNKFYFRRGTDDGDKIIYLCNEKYEIVTEWSLDQYKSFLHEKYLSNINLLTFRKVVGTFSRIAQKKNFFETSPLKTVMNTSEKECVNNLIKLLGKYDSIRKIESDITDLKKEISTIRSASKYNYLNKITKKQYIKNERLIESETTNLKSLTMEVAITLNNINSKKNHELYDLLNQLRKEKKQLVNRIRRLENNLVYNRSVSENDFTKLSAFFENVNIDKINDIEKFHYSISNILVDDLMSSLRDSRIELSDLNKEIERIENKILSISSSKEIPTSLVNPLIKKISLINEKRNENDLYDTFTEKENTKKSKTNELEETKEFIIEEISEKINSKMKKLNDVIYGKGNRSPLFELTQGKHSLSLPDNTGTGRGYANLIIFDLCILIISNLPFIIHDSVMFKQIGNVPMSKIIDTYNSQEKQCFIALDEIKKYGEQTENVLKKNSFIELTKDKTLFIKDWA